MRSYELAECFVNFYTDIVFFLHCKNEPVVLTLIWLQEFQCCIDNKYYACEV